MLRSLKALVGRESCSVRLEGFGISWRPEPAWRLARYEGTDRILSTRDPDRDAEVHLVIEPGAAIAGAGELVVREEGPPEARYRSFSFGESGTQVALPAQLGKRLERWGRLSPGPAHETWTLRSETFCVPFPRGFHAYSPRSRDGRIPFELFDDEGMGVALFVGEGRSDPAPLDELARGKRVLRRTDALLELEDRDDEGNATIERFSLEARHGLVFLVFGGCVREDVEHMTEARDALVAGLEPGPTD